MNSNGTDRWKRGLDFTCIILSAPIWVPIMLLLAVWIKCVSPGPVFFRQDRVGFLGRRFSIYKFRSMHVGAPTNIHDAYCRDLMRNGQPMLKMDSFGDGRLIPCGRVMRAAGLDELPQIFNVIRGEMSLVGPRPCTPSEYEGYTTEQKERFEAIPGLTGLWQVSGKNHTTFEEMVRLDIQYARTKTLFGDLGIICRTPVAVWSQLRERSAAPKVTQSSAFSQPVSKYLQSRPLRR